MKNFMNKRSSICVVSAIEILIEGIKPKITAKQDFDDRVASVLILFLEILLFQAFDLFC